MTECQSCGRKHRPGTLFCSGCGVYLATGGTLQTDPLPEEELPITKANPWDNVPLVGPDETSPIPIPPPKAHKQTPVKIQDADAAPLAPLRIRVISTGREVRLSFISEAYIGRLDADHDIFPDLDLTPDARADDGVSRRHCKIHRRDSVYLVEDVGSANGTYLNGLRLNPHLLHVLKDEDELQLGRIKLKIIIHK
ncbi:MAG: FHA domain-containing protein [Chloroflexi bacterium]|nr:FHA domain-containing protein [Chloroflexota bacterium]